MKTEIKKSKKKSGKKGRLRLHTLWAKPHRFSASVTEEQDWQTEVPNVKLARVFGIVLILHVVAVGGILAFKMIERTSTAPIPLDPPKKETKISATEASKSKGSEKRSVSVDGVNVIVDDPSRLGMKHYRVRSGDNLLAVARRLEVSVSELEELNKLNKGNELYAGQVLLVPSRKISAMPAQEIQRLVEKPVPDAVVRAETAAPAEPEKPVVKKPVVMKAERMADLKPAPTPVLTPAGTDTPVAKAVPAPKPVTVRPPQPVPTRSKTYVVQPGDTPYGIARRFGVSPDELMRVNNIPDPRFLKVGREIRIPLAR